MEIEIEIYETRTGRCPFDSWFKSVREIHTKAKILSRLDRLKLGNFGDCKSLSDGIYELRIHMDQAYVFITRRSGTKLYYFFAAVIKARKPGTSRKQRSI